MCQIKPARVGRYGFEHDQRIARHGLGYVRATTEPRARLWLSYHQPEDIRVTAIRRSPTEPEQSHNVRSERQTSLRFQPPPMVSF